MRRNSLVIGDGLPMTIVTLAVAGGVLLFWIVGLQFMIPTWSEAVEFCRDFVRNPGNHPIVIFYAAIVANALLVPTLREDDEEASPETAFGYWGNAFLWSAFGMCLAGLIGRPTDKDAIAIGFLVLFTLSIQFRRMDYYARTKGKRVPRPSAPNPQ